MNLRLFLPACLFIAAPSLVNAQVSIHEVCASNIDIILDEEGDSSDWIELWNPGASAVSLNGWYLSDDADEVLKWALPHQTLAPDERLPVCFVLAGFTGRGQSYLETHPWKRSVASLYDEACAAGDAPRAILVFPDCFTALGGSQYVNSSATGRYEDHIVQELVPWVDERYPTLPGRRAVCGKSSGGFGAMHLSMRHPEVFPAVGSISGDCGFEFVFAAELLACARGLLVREQTPAEFLAAFRDDPDLSGDAHAILNALAMAACYSPAPETGLGFELPIDLQTGEQPQDRQLHASPTGDLVRQSTRDGHAGDASQVTLLDPVEGLAKIRCARVDAAAAEDRAALAADAHHVVRAAQLHRHRLLARHHFDARFGTGDGHFFVKIVGDTNINGIDVVTTQNVEHVLVQHAVVVCVMSIDILLHCLTPG